MSGHSGNRAEYVSDARFGKESFYYFRVGEAVRVLQFFDYGEQTFKTDVVKHGENVGYLSSVRVPLAVDSFRAENRADVNARDCFLEHAVNFVDVDFIFGKTIGYIPDFYIENTGDCFVYGIAGFGIVIFSVSRRNAEKFAETFADRHIVAQTGNRADDVLSYLVERKFGTRFAYDISYGEIEKGFRHSALQARTVRFNPSSVLVFGITEGFKNVPDGKIAEDENYFMNSVLSGRRVGKRVINVGQIEIGKELQKSRRFLFRTVVFLDNPFSVLSRHSEKRAEPDAVEKFIHDENVTVVSARNILGEKISQFYRVSFGIGEKTVESAGDVVLVVNAHGTINLAERKFAESGKPARNEFVADGGRAGERRNESAEFKVRDKPESVRLTVFHYVFIARFFKYSGENTADRKFGKRADGDGRSRRFVFRRKRTDTVFAEFFALFVIENGIRGNETHNRAERNIRKEFRNVNLPG